MTQPFYEVAYRLSYFDLELNTEVNLPWQTLGSTLFILRRSVDGEVIRLVITQED